MRDVTFTIDKLIGNQGQIGQGSIAFVPLGHFQVVNRSKVYNHSHLRYNTFNNIILLCIGLLFCQGGQ